MLGVVGVAVLALAGWAGMYALGQASRIAEGEYCSPPDGKDCKLGLICIDHTCRAECGSARSCAPGQRCVEVTVVSTPVGAPRSPLEPPSPGTIVGPGRVMLICRPEPAHD